MLKSGSVYTTLLILITQHQLRFVQTKFILEQYYLSRFQEMCPKVSSIQEKHLNSKIKASGFGSDCNAF
jgi:hypothetical protein